MRLSDLMAAVTDEDSHGSGFQIHAKVDLHMDIASLHYNAQSVTPGGLFVAVPGYRSDGHDYIDTARERGAVAVVAQRAVRPEDGVITVGNTRRAMAEMAARFYGNPSDRIGLIGITGTNGKTTTAYLLESILWSAGVSAGLMGTIHTRHGDRRFKSAVTTPESIDLQRTLSQMREGGATHVVMEVSSHGIALERIRGCTFSMAVFTNLSQDHLDFHGTMAEYWRCKQRLFTDYLKPGGGVAVINTEDARGSELARRLPVKTVTAGRSAQCRVRVVDEHYRLSGIAAAVQTPAGAFDFHSPLVGRHNMENILCAVGAAVALDIPLDAIQRGIEHLDAVPGRLESVPNARRRHVLVDYAHTPHALENALNAIRSITDRRIVCVFGCGGDRDRGKRPMMGEIAGRIADLAVITSDNPRSEDPLEIISQITAGARRTFKRQYRLEDIDAGISEPGFVVEPDRKAAIRLAVFASRPGDAVLIAGKGHETYQIIGGRTFAFDDRKAAGEVLKEHPCTETAVP